MSARCWRHRGEFCPGTPPRRCRPLIETRATTCCHSVACCSGGCQADGFKGSIEFLAQRDVMLIQGVTDFGWATAWTHDAGQQRLDDLLAQKEVGTQGPHSGRIDVAYVASMAAATNEQLAR